MGWCDEVRRLRVRANADVPRDAQVARALGAEGIGLCRTEHMFFATERIPHVVTMILNAQHAREAELKITAAETELRAASRSELPRLRETLRAARAEGKAPLEAFRGALAKLLPLQRADFKGLFLAMEGRPVTIRTLDPPLHEFLPKRDDLIRELAGLGRTAKESVTKKRLARTLARVEELHEFNPMLGFRGCRLGIEYPEISAMQARAVFEAAALVQKEGIKVRPEIMIPLVAFKKELDLQLEVVHRVAKEVQDQKKVKLNYMVGTMIEVPRGALTADEIAQSAEFFSFGTNDLTQTALGMSRDDSGSFLPNYAEHEIVTKNPFATIDGTGVGQLVDLAVTRGRATRRDLKLGICGEHGGDPASIHFFEKVKLDYVSCSPFRVPVARLAAAQAALSTKAAD
jgi:pyruvate,orthophosphate dikinase